MLMTFCVLNNETSFDKFLDLLNKQQKNIKFTEEDKSDTLPFLDVGATITEFGIETMIYRKQTYTNLALKFIAICFINWNSGLIINLSNQAKLLPFHYSVV